MTRKSAGKKSYTSPCADLRDAYHDCFNRWYSEKFSKGQWDKEGCVSEWEKYRACLFQNLEDKNLRRYLEDETSSHTNTNTANKSVDGEDTTK
ncbi:hypothetical protein QJS04_geneDACA017860 [Acorus gramineus]|uniref:Uncharacterized protein n=1 Tax=Acorus gramineus TaxID=55184 RepID=A0AAV9AM36_ACOGR|nr:hypothetical protein QJS04_geneDACA017860 [Acorus gramineus]